MRLYDGMEIRDFDSQVALQYMCGKGSWDVAAQMEGPLKTAEQHTGALSPERGKTIFRRG